MVKYPDEAYTPVMDYYKQLPEELKPQATNILSDFAKKYAQGEAPPEEMLNRLKLLTSKKEGGLETKMHLESKNTLSQLFEGVGRFFSNPVAAGATALLLVYLGLPPYQP